MRRDGINRCTKCGSEDLFSGIWSEDGLSDENGKGGTVCNNCGHLQFTRERSSRRRGIGRARVLSHRGASASDGAQ